jgi:aminopeptidase N
MWKLRRRWVPFALVLCAARFAPADTTLVLRGGHWLDVRAGRLRPNGAIVVRGGKIVAIHPPSDGWRPPAGARIVDLTGRTVLPGLIDAHVHLTLAGDADSNARATLLAGFTTVVDLGSVGGAGIRLRDAIARGAVPGPTVIAAGSWIGAKVGVCEFGGATVSGPNEARGRARADLDAGADVLKVCVTGWPADAVAFPDSIELKREPLEAVMEVARDARRAVFAHAIGSAGALLAATQGVRALAHTPVIDSAGAAALARSGVRVISTLATLGQLPGGAEVRRSFQRLRKAGVPIVLGTDAGVLPHGKNAEELVALTEAGLSPSEAIRAATVEAADLVGAKDIGEIRVGAAGDLLVVAGNPLRDIRVLERPVMVVKRGITYVPPAVGPGISHELARHRAATIRDVRYDLRLDVTALDSAVGRVTIRFKRSDTGDAILDFRGRRLGRALANGQAIPADAAWNGHLIISDRLLEHGENTLDLEFIADIAPSGASIIRAHDPTDGSDYLYTLLVPADANQLFPCFDQPDLKARVRVALTAPAAWSVVGNGAAASADTAGGRVTTRFDETKPVSTYLIAFAAGPWRHASSTRNGRTITAYVRRSRAAEADLDTLLALNHRALDWMERYYGRPFPFQKLDFVLAPAFPFGGMEHPGAIFYNEDRFIFRERPTLPQRLDRFSTILHEVAHQWFGDLVTMRWFDDLWLKEGFATFMAAKALNEIDPGADAWKTFYFGTKPPAYAVDQTDGTRPLWQELTNLDQAKSNYGAIVYDKAPSVLKQLEYLVGDSAFQVGVRDFLDEHAYASANWRELLGAIGRAADRPLAGFGRDFMLRPGMPVLEQRVVVHNGKIARLALAQHPARPLSGTRPWIERTEVLLGYRDRAPVRIPVELRGSVTVVGAAAGRPAPDFVFANARDYGYFLLLLDSASIKALDNGALARVDDSFLRAMLWGALWDQVRASRMTPERFVQLVLRELPRESDEQIVPVVLARLDRAVRAYLVPESRGKLQPEVERMLWDGSRDTTRVYGVRKAYADAFIGLAASPVGVRRLDTLITADSVAGEPLRDPTRWDVVARLLELGAPDADSRFGEQERRDTTADGRRRAFIAGAGRPSPTTKRDYFRRYFGDAALNEDWASGSLGEFNALEHETLTLPYLGPALDSLPFIQTHRRIFFLEAWLASFLRGQTSDSALAIVRQYLGGHPRLPLDLRRKVLQQVDELERTVRIRSAQG